MSYNFAYVDMAFINGNVYTVNKDDDVCEAVGVIGNKIVFTGKKADLDEYITDATQVIDLNGRCLVPGFIDSHFHPILNGLLENSPDAAMINTGGVSSVKELLELFQKALSKKDRGQWVSSMGYDPMNFEEKRHPTLEELDRIAPDNPIHCMHVSGHICMYNSKALEYLKIYSAEDAKQFPEDEVVAEDGKLTGMLRGHTHFYLWGKVAYTPKQQEKAAMISQKALLANGVTSIHDCGECDAPSYHLMQKLAREKKFKVRNYMLLHSIFGKSYSLEDNEHWLGLGLMSGLGDEYFKIGSSKFMIDGGSGAPSCATRDPYSHDPNLKGEWGWERQEVSNYILKIHRADCQATSHAMGDLAVEFMVEGYENAFKEEPKPWLRHRIEHCAVSDQDLIDRMAKMNICPTINSGMITVRGKHYGNIYGEKRSKYFSGLKSMLDAGIVASLASDAPSGPMGMAIMDGAVNRTDRGNGFVLGGNQCVSVPEALRCMTYNAAYASYEEDIKGSIEVGKLADFAVLNRDLSSCPRGELGNIMIDMTIIDGVVEFER
jgi:predicted amidohydrolase YtcJ